MMHPEDMINTIESSASNTRCVPALYVSWLEWKTILTIFFKIPTTFKITDFHAFAFKKHSPGYVFARPLSGSTTEHLFNLLKQNHSCDTVRRGMSEAMRNYSYTSKWSSLRDTKSSKEGTRQEYLRNTSLSGTFKIDVEFQKAYFGSGVRAGQ